MKNEAIWQFVHIGWGHKLSHRCCSCSTLEVRLRPVGKLKPREETWLMSAVLEHRTVTGTLKWCHLCQTSRSRCQVWRQITVEMISSSSSEAIATFQIKLSSFSDSCVWSTPVDMRHRLMFQVFIHLINSTDNNKHSAVNLAFILKCRT